jgi:hypothetical protein
VWPSVTRGITVRIITPMAPAVNRGGGSEEASASRLAHNYKLPFRHVATLGQRSAIIAITATQSSFLMTLSSGFTVAAK